MKHLKEELEKKGKKDINVFKRLHLHYLNPKINPIFTSTKKATNNNEKNVKIINH